jgi:hypothetical protein
MPDNIYILPTTIQRDIQRFDDRPKRNGPPEVTDINNINGNLFS